MSLEFYPKIVHRLWGIDEQGEYIYSAFFCGLQIGVFGVPLKSHYVHTYLFIILTLSKNKTTAFLMELA